MNENVNKDEKSDVVGKMLGETGEEPVRKLSGYRHLAPLHQPPSEQQGDGNTINVPLQKDELVALIKHCRAHRVTFANMDTAEEYNACISAFEMLNYCADEAGIRVEPRR